MPYDHLQPALANIRRIVDDKLRLFNSKLKWLVDSLEINPDFIRANPEHYQVIKNYYEGMLRFEASVAWKVIDEEVWYLKQPSFETAFDKAIDAITLVCQGKAKVNSAAIPVEDAFDLFIILYESTDSKH